MRRYRFDVKRVRPRTADERLHRKNKLAKIAELQREIKDGRKAKQGGV